MSDGDITGMSRPIPDQGTGGVVKSKPGNKFAAFLSDMEAFKKRVPNLSTKRNVSGSGVNQPTSTKDLAVQHPTRPTTKPTSGAANLQTKKSVSTGASSSKLFKSASKPNWYKSPSQATPFTTLNTAQTTLGRTLLDKKQKAQSTSRWSSSGFVSEDEELPYSSNVATAPKPPALLDRSKGNGTTAHETIDLSSEIESEDEDDGDDIGSEDDDDEDEDEDEDDDGDDNDDDDGDNDASQEVPQRSNNLRPMQNTRPPTRTPMKVSPSAAADIFPQLRDHNQKFVKLPRSFDGWRSGIQGLPKPTESQAESSLLSPRLILVRQRTGATKNTQLPQPKAKRTSLNEDILLYESLKAKSGSRAPKPSTVFVSRLPEPSEIRKATRISRENREKRSHKRKAWEPPVVAAPASVKRQAREDNRRSNTVFESKNTRPRNDVDDRNRNYAEDRVNQNLKPGGCTFPPPASPPRPSSPPPIDENRVVMQFTVFRTSKIQPQSFDGDLTGKIVRSGSFFNKNVANKRAEALLPSPSPSVARMELDYGEEGPPRNGMFFGRVEYKDGTFVYVYVDCEYQQFGKIDPSQFNGKRMNSQYKKLCLAPRYDVFVFLRKSMNRQGGVIYEYEEETRPEPVVDVIDDDDSDVESNHEIQTEGTVLDNGHEGDVIRIGSAAICDQDNPVQMNDNGHVDEGATNDSPVAGVKSSHESAADDHTTKVDGSESCEQGNFEDKSDDHNVHESAMDERNCEATGDKSSNDNDADSAVVEFGKAMDCDQDKSVDMTDDGHIEECSPDENQNTVKDKSKALPADHQESLGSHFQPKFEGSFTTLAQANAKALDAFARWTRPQLPARRDALMYYRDVLQPSINELRCRFRQDQDTREATQEAEISWEPCPQFRYDYEAINVVVVMSEMQGPLDLTGAFS
jgi:hypothetical protein